MIDYLLSILTCSLCFFFKAYFIIVAIALGIFGLLYIGTKITHEKSTFTYRMKFILVYYGVIFGVGLTGIPWFLLRPRHVKNPVICGWVVRKISTVLDITWEIRGANILSSDQAAILCLNHQLSLDIFACLNFWHVVKKMTAIAKKELLYVIPFGPAVWLSGIEYIDRKNAQKSYKQLDDLSDKLIRTKTKLIIFPEGTRNKVRGLLPFKKGAFKTAIKAQLPIIPVVFAPYYFIDGKQKTFERGHMIIDVLPAISTVGKTDSDLDDLLQYVRKLMEETYNKLCTEVDENSKQVHWRTKARPRMTLIDK